MNVAVITPYFNETIDILARAHESVISQTLSPGVEISHYMVCDGSIPNVHTNWDVHHLCLPKNYNDNGNTPRGIGALLAEREGADMITFLDADNWYHREHILSIINQMKAQPLADVYASMRTFHHIADGSDLQIGEPDELTLRHVDTSCFALTKRVFFLNHIWLRMPKALSPICDRVFFSGIKYHNLKLSHTHLSSVSFTTQYSYHYQLAGLVPPEKSKNASTFREAFAFLNSVDGITNCIEQIGFYPASYFT